MLDILAGRLYNIINKASRLKRDVGGKPTNLHPAGRAKSRQKGGIKMDTEKMKDLVRQDFKNDTYNRLIGFLVVEETIEAYPRDYFTEGTTLVAYMCHTGDIAYEKLSEMATNILEKKMKQVEGLAEYGPVKLTTTGGIYIITPPSHLPPDEDGWKLSYSKGKEYYYSLEDLWDNSNIKNEGIMEIC